MNAKTTSDTLATPGRVTRPPERIAAWRAFEHNLQHVLTLLKEDCALVIAEKGTNHFVQFVGQGREGMRVETVSNAYLSCREKLSDRQVEALLALS